MCEEVERTGLKGSRQNVCASAIRLPRRDAFRGLATARACRMKVSVLALVIPLVLGENEGVCVEPHRPNDNSKDTCAVCVKAVMNGNPRHWQHACITCESKHGFDCRCSCPATDSSDGNVATTATPSIVAAPLDVPRNRLELNESCVELPNGNVRNDTCAVCVEAIMNGHWKNQQVACTTCGSEHGFDCHCTCASFEASFFATMGGDEAAYPYEALGLSAINTYLASDAPGGLAAASDVGGGGTLAAVERWERYLDRGIEAACGSSSAQCDEGRCGGAGPHAFLDSAVDHKIPHDVQQLE